MSTTGTRTAGLSPVAVFLVITIAHSLASSAQERAAAAADSTVKSLFNDAFSWRTEDGANEIRVGGAVHFDGRAYLGDSVAPDSFDIRRARLDLQAKVHGFMELRIQAAMEDSPYIRNAWLDVKRSDAVRLRLGQMKVPFSTEWLTLDNQVNFIERATSTPLYPFFDRGFMLWGDLVGKRLTYQFGAFTGAGVDVDATKGDIDDHKDVALRLFAQPFKARKDHWLQGLYLALQGTSGSASVPTQRFETKGLRAPNYESLLWRWRTEQVIASDGSAQDVVAGEIQGRDRWGAELHWLRGPFTASFEWLEVSYDDIVIHHDYWLGSQQLKHEPALACDGDVQSTALFFSLFLTGEEKKVDAQGWRQPDPRSEWAPGQGGTGAWELLARLSRTESSPGLFYTVRVNGFTAADLGNSQAPPIGQGRSLQAAVLQGTEDAYEATVGLNWTANHNLRVQLGWTTVWARDFVEGSRGVVSGGSSDLAERTQKNRLVEREHCLGLRFIFRI